MVDEGEFKGMHLRLIKDLRPIQASFLGFQYKEDYVVPESNFDELEKRIKHFSCHSQRWDGEKVDSYRSAAKFCKLCSPTEPLKVLHAGEFSYDSATFYGFPRDIYQFTPIITLDFDKVKEIYDVFLKNFYDDVKEKGIIGLNNQKKNVFKNFVHYGMTSAGYEENPIKSNISNLESFLQDLEKLVKGKEEWDLNRNKFRLCSLHNNKECLSNIKEELIGENINKFSKEYGISLEGKNFYVDFQKEKVFSVK